MQTKAVLLGAWCALACMTAGAYADQTIHLTNNSSLTLLGIYLGGIPESNDDLDKNFIEEQTVSSRESTTITSPVVITDCQNDIAFDTKEGYFLVSIDLCDDSNRYLKPLMVNDDVLGFPDTEELMFHNGSTATVDKIFVGPFTDANDRVKQSQNILAAPVEPGKVAPYRDPKKPGDDCIQNGIVVFESEGGPTRLFMHGIDVCSDYFSLTDNDVFGDE